jgi:hypothetical protein
MDIKLVDVVVHVDESIDRSARTAMEDSVRELQGVVSVGQHDEKPHLMVVEYNPDQTSSGDILALVRGQGVHAEIVGL